MSSLRRYKRFLSCPGCCSWPSTKFSFSSPNTISLHLSRSPSKLGSQSCRVACLLICVYGFSYREEVEREGCVRDTSGHAALALLDIFRKGVNKKLKGTVSRDGFCFVRLNILISTAHSVSAMMVFKMAFQKLFTSMSNYI